MALDPTSPVVGQPDGDAVVEADRSFGSHARAPLVVLAVVNDGEAARPSGISERPLIVAPPVNEFSGQYFAGGAVGYVGDLVITAHAAVLNTVFRTIGAGATLEWRASVNTDMSEHFVVPTASIDGTGVKTVAESFTPVAGRTYQPLVIAPFMKLHVNAITSGQVSGWALLKENGFSLFAAPGAA